MFPQSIFHTFSFHTHFRKVLFTAFVFVVLPALAGAQAVQCVSIINLPDTVELCRNETYQLNPSVVSSGFLSTTDTTWTPSAGLSNPNVINPLVTLGNTSQTYTLSITALTPTNFVNNGNFNNGNTGFSTSYLPGNGGAYGLLSNEGTYAVTSNPSLVHNNFASFTDHTGNPGGQMLVVNGSSTANTNVWCQLIAVTPNTWYDFSAWGATCVGSAPAILQFSINNTSLGTPLTLPTATGVWTNFHALWFSGANTSVNICITNQNTAPSGNDFAIDDIEFRQQCITQDSVYFHVTNLQTAITSDIHFGCKGDSVKFTAVNLGELPDRYEWDFGDNSNGDSSRNPSHTYQQQGNYTVRLITSKLGCKDTATAIINTLHPLQASFTIDKDSICLGETIIFNSTSTATIGNPTHYWNFGDGSTSNSAGIGHQYTTIGRFPVTYVVTDGVPCTDTARDTIYVFKSYNPSFTINDSVFCEGAGVQIHILDDHPFLTRDLSLGDGTIISNTKSILHNYDTSGSFVIRLNETYSLCPSDSMSKSIVVLPFPRINLGPDTVLCPGNAPIQIYDRNQAANLSNSYLWSNGDSNTRFILARDQGTYWATVMQGDCAATDSIVVRKDCYLDIPNAFTPNGDGDNDYFFPRQLLGSNVTKFRMSVFNRWGQRIFETNSTDGRGWDGRFNGEAQPAGVFIYQMEAEFLNRAVEKYSGNVTLLR